MKPEKMGVNGMTEKGRKKAGFTLVEMMAVASLAAILSSFALSAVAGAIHFKKGIDTEGNAEALKEALLRYFEDVGTFPVIDAGDTTVGSTGLRKLGQNLDNRQGWKGSYMDPKVHQKFLVDGWDRNFRYRFGVNANGVGVALILSPGRNGVVDSNLTNWTQDGWVPQGDDIARKASVEEIIKWQEERVRRQLLLQRGRLIATNPTASPTVFPLPTDIWGRNLLYARCSPYSAFIYSVGYDGVDNSGGATGICARGYPLGDDLMENAKWEVMGRLAGLLNDGWTGGIHANQAVCSAYTYVAVNNFNDPLIIDYYDSQLNHRNATVAPRSTQYIPDVYPWMMTGNRVPLVVYRNGVEYDDFLGANADMDQDCYYQKIFYNAGG